MRVKTIPLKVISLFREVTTAHIQTESLQARQTEKNHTITIEGEAGPLFDTLRGSVSNLNVEFKDDVNGVPFAVDILNEDDSELLLKNITIEVGGDILPSEHDYTEHYAQVLAPPYNYGNWYINYSGQPVWLATGFAWYLWGASV